MKINTSLMASLLLFANLSYADLPGFDSSEIKIPNFARVTNQILRGGRPETEADLCVLSAIATGSVINIQGGDYSGNTIVGALIPYWESGETPAEIAQEGGWAHAAGLRYYNFPINSLKPLRWAEALKVERILNRIHLEVTATPQRRVFVHCAHGNDRTGLIIALYRMRYQNWSANDAYSEMRRSGHSLVNMITTWPLDLYFFRYARWLAKKRGLETPTKWQQCQKILSVR